MMRLKGVLAILALGMLVGRVAAQPDPTVKTEALPMYEDQMAGVRLGWHARSITGLWNFNNLNAAQINRLRRTYRMPDHIIMRLGTKMPVVTGSGSGQSSNFVFYMGPYGRGVSESNAGGDVNLGGGGLGGEPGMIPGQAAQALSDQEVWNARVKPFLAQALGSDAADDVPFVAQAQFGAAVGGVAPAGMAPNIAGPSMSAGEFAGGATNVGGGMGMDPGMMEPGMEGAPGGGGGGGGVGALLGLPGLDELAPDLTLPDRSELVQDLLRLDRFYTADRATLEAELVDLTQRLARLGDRLIGASAVDNDAEVLRIVGELVRVLALGEAIQRVLAMPDVVHVFHTGLPDRDITFVYEPAPNIWVSFSINFFTWQINGITVAGNRPWGGARLATAPTGVPGITLGSSLEQIFNRYGWPDEFESFMGRYLLVSYYDTNNVGFLLDHPSPKVWRVIRMMIEPRPNGSERQLAGFRLGQNAQELLVFRARRGHGPIAYGQPYVVERPNHRVTMVPAGVSPMPGNRPPGILLDRRLGPLFGGGGLGGGLGGEEGIPGEPGDPGAAPPGLAMAAALGYGARYTAATDGAGRSRTAQAQTSPADAGLPGEGGLGGVEEVPQAIEAAIVQNRFPMPYFFSRDGFNVEALCGAEAVAAGPQPLEGGVAALEGMGAGGEVGPGAAGGGTAASRDALADILNEIYHDPTGQTGFNIAYGFRSSTSNCAITTAIDETRYRWDYAYNPDVKAEFGLDTDGMVTQIGVLGTVWPGARSERGVALGNNLRDVLLRYGPPLLYQEFTQDVAELQPNISIMSYARDDRGRPYGNVNFALQDMRVTAMQIVALPGYRLR